MSLGDERSKAQSGAGPTDPEAAAIALPIEDSIDLHTFRPRDVPAVVQAYLDAARRAGLREVRLIHGKGKGIQRDRIRALLRADPGVEDAFEAPPGRGAWGATVVRLRARTPD